jgi:hypothetical protein
MRSKTIRASMLAVAAALCLTSCNALVGAGAVVVLGGVGVLASQCYDRVQVRVIDPATGGSTCDADVSVADADGSERSVRPCYNTALTEGHWRIIARRPGYVPASSEITIAERDGACPHYVHSVQLTMRREGEPVTNPVARSRDGDRPSAPPATTTELESPPARVVPPPIPGVPTKAFEPVAPSPASPTPSPPPAAQPPSPPSPPPPAAPPAPSPTPSHR